MGVELITRLFGDIDFYQTDGVWKAKVDVPRWLADELLKTSVDFSNIITVDGTGPLGMATVILEFQKNEPPDG